jgi:type 1 glutamine amidotransferase
VKLCQCREITLGKFLRFELGRRQVSLAAMKRFCLSAVALTGLLAMAQGQPASNTAAPAPFEWGPGLKVLMVGGGWAHDYHTYFDKADTDALHAAGITNTLYTEDAAVVARELPHADVLLLSNNKTAFDTPEFREAFSNYVSAGKGLVLLHAAIWYNWHWGKIDSDGFNRAFVGGGARDHDGVSEFDETIVKEHPVTHGLPATFKMTDELYHTATRPDAVPIEVLAEASRPGGQKYASVWLVHNGPNRIVCIALGHDGAPRTHPEFQQLLVNAVNWAGGQK